MSAGARVLGAVLAASAAGMATAQPAIQAPAFYTDRWGPSVAFPTLNGDYLHLFATVLSPDQPNQVTAVATQGAIVRNMAFFSGPIFAEKNFESYLTNTSLTGPWNLTVTDTHGSTNGSFAAIADPEFLPLMQNVQVSGAGTTPTVSWTLPNLSGFDVDAIRVRAVIAGTGVQIFQSALLPTTTSSFSFQSGVLALGETYEFRILLEDFVGQMEENRSNTFSPLLTTTVAAVPEPESWALLLGGLALFAVRRGATRPAKPRADGRTASAEMPRSRRR